MGNKNASVELDNRRKILNATQKLIQKKGVAASSLSAVAKMAGVAKGTLYYYFPSKASLLIAVAENQGDIYSKRFLELIQNNKNTLAVDELITEMTTSESSLILLHLLLEGIVGDEKLQQQLKLVFHKWSSNIKIGLEQLSKKEIPIDLAGLVHSSLIGLHINAAICKNSVNSELFRSFIFNGLNNIKPEEKSIQKSE